MKKTLLLALFLLAITTQTLTANTLYLNAGPTTFEQNFDPALTYGASYDIESPNGLGLSLGASYTDAKSKDTLQDLKTGILYTEAIYHHNPKDKISPFVGAGFNLNYLPSTYNSPTWGYQASAGLRFRLDRHTRIRLKIEKHYIKETNLNTKIYPLTISFGIGHHFADAKPKKKRKKKRHRRKKDIRNWRDGKRNKLRAKNMKQANRLQKQFFDSNGGYQNVTWPSF